MTTNLSPKDAAELFVNSLIAGAYDGAITGMASILEKGPAGRNPAQDLITLHQWFQGLDNENRELVLTVIRKAIDAALFNCLVFLDGMAGYLVKGEESDFAVYFQTYENRETRKADSPQTSVRVNSTDATEFLHDLFHWILQERAEHEA